jgi:hypothetical protein
VKIVAVCNVTYRGADKSLVRPTSLSIVFFRSMEQVLVRRGQNLRVGWVIKTLEAQVGQFLLGCKCPVRRFLPGRAKDLSAPQCYTVWSKFTDVLEEGVGSLRATLLPAMSVNLKQSESLQIRKRDCLCIRCWGYVRFPIAVGKMPY